jgi:hypothetical protein
VSSEGYHVGSQTIWRTTRLRKWNVRRSIPVLSTQVHVLATSRNLLDEEQMANLDQNWKDWMPCFLESLPGEDSVSRTSLTAQWGENQFIYIICRNDYVSITIADFLLRACCWRVISCCMKHFRSSHMCILLLNSLVEMPFLLDEFQPYSEQRSWRYVVK